MYVYLGMSFVRIRPGWNLLYCLYELSQCPPVISESLVGIDAVAVPLDEFLQLNACLSQISVGVFVLLGLTRLLVELSFD